MDSRLFDDVLTMISRWSPKGEQLLSSGVRLVCPVPHVAPEAWLHVLFPPLTKPEIEEMEKQLHALLPDDFKNFLLSANGLEMFAYTISIWGIRKSLERAGDEAWQPFNLTSHNDEADRPDGSPDAVIYFASTNGGDSWCFFEFDENNYRVGKTDRDNFQPTAYWPNFDAWLRDEMESIETVFDSEGRMLSNPPLGRVM